MLDNIIEIFMVEDNEGDVFLARKAFESLSRSYRITVANDGETALKMLRGEAGFQEVPQPHMIFLDINLPGQDGKKILRDIKEDARLRRVPVIVLSSSKAEHDIFQVYDDLATAYLAKPETMSEFRSIVESIDNFWFKHCLFSRK